MTTLAPSADSPSALPMLHPGQRPHVTLVDGHVHVHAAFDTGELLQRADDNLRRAALLLNCSSYTPVLGLSETYDSRWFEETAARSGTSISGWRIKRTDEDCSLELEREVDAARLVVISGSQIVTSERLEVLGLFSDERVEDGLPIRETVSRVVANGGIPVIPWGFGKWWGRRGRELAKLLASPEGSHVRLGDNGGRTPWLPCPAPLKVAAKVQQQILSGSDPLPFRREIARAGSFGFAVDVRCSARRPAQSLKRALAEPAAMVRPFGRLTPGMRFAINQIRMQFHKHLLH